MSNQTITKEIMTNIYTNGTYYDPARDHHGPNTTVMCDRCRKDNLDVCLGWKEYDLCMACVSEIRVELNKKSNNLCDKQGRKQNDKQNDIQNMMRMEQEQFNQNKKRPNSRMLQRQFYKNEELSNSDEINNTSDIYNVSIKMRQHQYMTRMEQGQFNQPTNQNDHKNIKVKMRQNQYDHENVKVKMRQNQYGSDAHCKCVIL